MNTHGFVFFDPKKTAVVCPQSYKQGVMKEKEFLTQKGCIKNLKFLNGLINGG